MRVKRLKLSGFKSFVEPAELRVEDGLTGIVGPNGCGKSNVLEAIRWVMGESSPKSMRGAGMDDVIFAGTALRPARDFAEVSLLVERDQGDQSGDIAVAPLGEVEITRRIERGAGSAYRVNGRDVRQKDVALLFADAATGAHSPALVSQGKISAVIAAKPTERRLMLEEAAGIAGLHVRRKDAEQKLRATEANLIRLDEILADMELREVALRRQARAAERYRKLTDQIRVAEARLIFARWREAAAAAEAATREAEAAEQAVARAAEAQRAAAACQNEAAAARRRQAQGRRRRRAKPPPRSATSSPRSAPSATACAAGSPSWRSAAAPSPPTGCARRRSARTPPPRSAGWRRSWPRSPPGSPPPKAAALTIDVRTVEHEDEARAAETALGQARAVQAAEQAEARVALAALDAARQKLARAEAEAHADRRADGRPRRRRRSARHASAGPHRPRGRPRPGSNRPSAAIAAAETARQAGGGRARCRRKRGRRRPRQLSALQSEAQALIKAVETSGGDRAINHVKAAPGYERALAAALGEDLDAALSGDGPRRWAGAEPQASDPALPPARPRSPTMSRRRPLCSAASARSRSPRPTTAPRSRSASVWSRSTGACAAGTAMSRPAWAPPPPSG